MTLGYKDAKILADKISKEIEFPKDFIIRKRAKIIVIKHMDGSVMEFHSACFRKLDEDWMVVFTEHHGDFVYHKDDLISIEEHRRTGPFHYYNENA